MNCSEARPLLAAGDPAAEAHLETCAACGDWLERHDPIVVRFRAARPEALPAPASLRLGVLRRLGLRRSWSREAFLAGALTGALAAAAVAAVAVFQQPLLGRLADYSAPLLRLLESPRELLAGNLPALLLTVGVTVLMAGLAALVYRDLGQPRQGMAR
jgi:hypothetical protein